MQVWVHLQSFPPQVDAAVGPHLPLKSQIPKLCERYLDLWAHMMQKDQDFSSSLGRSTNKLHELHMNHVPSTNLCENLKLG
jgi:hypothetical protein